MGFIEKLNKYGVSISVHKTKSYENILTYQEYLNKKGIKVTIKNEVDLMKFIVLCKGLETQFQIDLAFELFMNSHHDILNYMSYDEKRNMFNSDIALLLESAPFIYDEQAQTKIYLPYYEPFLNKRYTEDYQILLLKQHREHIKNIKFNQNTPNELYSVNYLKTNFLPTEIVYEDERHICFYFDDMKTVYIYNTDNQKQINKVIVCDKDYKGNILVEDVKTLMAFIEGYDYSGCLAFIEEKGYYSKKVCTKIAKRFK